MRDAHELSTYYEIPFATRFSSVKLVARVDKIGVRCGRQRDRGIV